MKIQKKYFFWGGWGGRVGGDEVGCERRTEVFVKIQFFFFFFFFGGGEGSGWGGGQGGCERRIEVFVKIQKKIGVGVRVGGVRGCQGGRVGVRVDVNVEVKFS